MFTFLHFNPLPLYSYFPSIILILFTSIDFRMNAEVTREREQHYVNRLWVICQNITLEAS